MTAPTPARPEDSAAVNLYETSNGLTLDYERIDGTGHSEGLKITSQARDIVVTVGRLEGGREDCLDVNNLCRNIKVTAGWRAAGKYLATVKGGSEGIWLEGFVYRHGAFRDVDFGNWSDQSNNWCKRCSLALRSLDGTPIRIRCLQAEAPALVPGTGPYVFDFPSPLAWYHGIAIWLLQLWWRLTRPPAEDQDSDP
jgi:hypothetical protein